MITDEVRRGIESRGGPEGLAWIEALPAIVARVSAAWSLTTGPMLEGGKGGLVMRVQRGGQDAVLKIGQPGAAFARQVATLEAADGRGYVRLLAADLSVNAALLEPLGASLGTSSLPVTEQLDALATTLLAAWQAPLPAATDWHKATHLIEDIARDWEQLGQPCSAALKDAAIRYARSRLAATTDTVLCHGDPHPGNLLAVARQRRGAESGYVFVDPDGFGCEPAYDLGVTVRAFTSEVLAAADPVTLLHEWCTRLASTTGVDAEAIWEWAFVERVSSGLYLMTRGHHDEGRTYLTSAERLLP